MLLLPCLLKLNYSITPKLNRVISIDLLCLKIYVIKTNQIKLSPVSCAACAHRLIADLYFSILVGLQILGKFGLINLSVAYAKNSCSFFFARLCRCGFM